MIETLTTAFIVGLLGAGHCIGMCGGIGAALTFALKPDAYLKRFMLIIAYNLGRISSYVFMGALAAAALSLLPSSAMPVLRTVSGVLLILMACYLAGVWRILSRLEKLGGMLWKLVQPLTKGLLPVKSLHQAVLLGAVWGWLPCGLVYTALSYATVQADMSLGALTMLAFGLGTLPAVVTGGLAADAIKSVLQAKGFRLVMALCLFAFGAWTIWGGIQHAGHSQHHSSQSESNTDQPEHHHHH